MPKKKCKKCGSLVFPLLESSREGWRFRCPMCQAHTSYFGRLEEIEKDFICSEENSPKGSNAANVREIIQGLKGSASRFEKDLLADPSFSYNIADAQNKLLIKTAEQLEAIVRQEEGDLRG